MCLVVSDIIWAHQNKWSGRIAYPEYLSMGFNVFFTAWHILFVLGFDEDVPDSVANETPALYLVGPRRALFNAWIFTEWMLYAAWHGAVAWLLPNLWFGGDKYSLVCEQDVGGEKDFSLAQEFWLGSITSFTLVVCIVNLRLLILAQSPFNKWSLGSSGLAFLSYIVWLLLLSEWSFGQTMQCTVKGLAMDFFSTGKCLGAVGLGIIIALAVDVLEKFVRYNCFPTELDKTRARGWKEQTTEEKKVSDMADIIKTYRTADEPEQKQDNVRAQPYGQLQEEASLESPTKTTSV